MGVGVLGDLCLRVSHFTPYCLARSRLGVWRGCHDDKLEVLGKQAGRRGVGRRAVQGMVEAPRSLNDEMTPQCGFTSSLIFVPRHTNE